MSAVMVVVMAILLPVFLLVAALRPFVFVGGIIATICGFVNLAHGGSPATLIVGLVLIVLALFVRVTHTSN